MSLPPRPGTTLLILCIALVSSACGDDATVRPYADVRPAADMQASSPDAPAKEAPGLSGAAAAPSVQQVTPAPATHMIIRSGSASIQVDSLETAMAAARALAARVGGTVGNTTLDAGDYQVRRASLELKIPSARFDDALSGLAPLGKVESVSSTAEDVGEEFVDVTARVANARRLEERLVSILATRAGKLEEVLAVERELARVREEIERYEGRIRYLTSRVAMSTLMLNLHEREPLVGASPGDNVLVKAFRNAWRNFVHFIAGFIALMGFLIPLSVLAGVGYIVWRRVRGTGS